MTSEACFKHSATDALALPSVMHGRRVWPAGART